MLRPDEVSTRCFLLKLLCLHHTGSSFEILYLHYLKKTTHVSSLTNTDLIASDMSKELEVVKDKLENECAKLKQNKFFRVSDISGNDVKVQ
jgi:hypothetical protein